MSFGTASGTFIDLRSGDPFTGSSLGTLSSVVQLNRGTPGVGPVPTDNGDGTWEVDLTAYTGFCINLTVNSDIEFLYPAIWASAFTNGMAIRNYTNFADALAGKMDHATQRWVAASELSRVAGIPYWKTLAPVYVNIPIKDPPGLLQPSSTTENTPTTGPYNPQP